MSLASFVYIDRAALGFTVQAFLPVAAAIYLVVSILTSIASIYSLISALCRKHISAGSNQTSDAKKLTDC
jgi:hypothetical protein